jgi:hypothetical protein
MPTELTAEYLLPRDEDLYLELLHAKPPHLAVYSSTFDTVVDDAARRARVRHAAARNAAAREQADRARLDMVDAANTEAETALKEAGLYTDRYSLTRSRTIFIYPPGCVDPR